MKQFHGTWGNRTILFQSDTVLVTLLDLRPEQRCSWHNHKTAWNQFSVISGELGVKTDKGFLTKVCAGSGFTVEPGVYHEFQVYKYPTRVVEIAYVQYDHGDIDRKKLGGPLDE